MVKLRTRECKNERDIRDFFEQSALDYRESHGHPERLFRYRMRVLENMADFNGDEILLDLGCGDGHHLFYLSRLISEGIGIDFAENMIVKAKKTQKKLGDRNNLSFRVDRAQKLKTVGDGSVDIVICIGSFEHMLKKEKVIVQVRRVLKENGRFFLLTPNGNYIWYRWLAPLFGQDTRHLSTDRFLSHTDLTQMFSGPEWSIIHQQNWTFIPRGDMNRWQAGLLTLIDIKGKIFRISLFRGGIAMRIDKKR